MPNEAACFPVTQIPPDGCSVGLSPGPRRATARLRLAMRLAPSLHLRRKSEFEAQGVIDGPRPKRLFPSHQKQ